MMKRPKRRSWQVYLLECADGTYYCGATNNLVKRVQAHQAGKAAKYTRGRRPVTLVAVSRRMMTKSEALRCEARVKKLPRNNKREAVRLV